MKSTGGAGAAPEAVGFGPGALGASYVQNRPLPPSDFYIRREKKCRASDAHLFAEWFVSHRRSHSCLSPKDGSVAGVTIGKHGVRDFERAMLALGAILGARCAVIHL